MNIIRIIKKFILCICFLLSCSLLIPEDVFAKTCETSFWVEFIDVGQGDSALIQCDGHYMLIDGGPSSASSVIYTILKNKGISYIDVIIATHPDSDHIGGLSGALNYAKVGTFYCSVKDYDTKTFNSIVKNLNKQKKSITIPKIGSRIKLGSAEVDLVAGCKASDDTNNDSIVTKITYGKNSFLFMGDAEEEEEKLLIKSGFDISCDVIKIGHHGSAGSTSSALLEKVSPSYAVISVGKQNDYAHPTKKTLNRLKNAKVDIYRTDLQGDITFSSDGSKLTVVTQKKADAGDLWLPGDSNNKTTDKVVIPEGTTYVLNTRSKKIHIPSCKSVTDMAAYNRSFSTLTKEELIKAGYSPCGSCRP